MRASTNNLAPWAVVEVKRRQEREREVRQKYKKSKVVGKNNLQASNHSNFV